MTLPRGRLWNLPEGDLHKLSKFESGPNDDYDCDDLVDISQRTTLQEWVTGCIEADENADLIYKENVINQALWVRDAIPWTLFNTPAWPRYTEDKALSSSENWKRRMELKPQVFVDSTHRSKSCVIPVYYMEFCGIKIVMRNNFHDWNVSISSPFAISGLITRLFPHDANYCYYQGFPQDMRFKAYSEDNQKEFSFYSDTRETLSTFFWLLGQMIKDK